MWLGKLSFPKHFKKNLGPREKYLLANKEPEFEFPACIYKTGHNCPCL